MVCRKRLHLDRDFLECTHFLSFPKWDGTSNTFETAIVAFGLVWLFGFILLVCEPGERMTNRFEIFSEELSRSDWYLLPIEMQRIYLVFLSNTQNAINVSSYGGITCERETSKKVWKLTETHSQMIGGANQF